MPDAPQRRGPTEPRITPEIMARALSHPAYFMSDILRARLWATQAHICDAIAAPGADVACKGCHGCSKTFTAAGVAAWWAAHDDNAICVTTAPTAEQVKRQVWAEVHKAVADSYIEFPRLNQVEIPIDRNNYAVGISTNDVTRFQGFHGKVLFIIDEAPGVFPGLWEAIEGARSGGDVRVLKLGNPTVSGGPFYRDFTQKASRVRRFTISAFNTPNFMENPAKGITAFTLDDIKDIDDENDPRLQDPYGGRYSFLVTRKWVWNIYRTEGPDSTYWISRVLAQFPPQSVYALFSVNLLEDAQADAYDDGLEECIAGLDVAGPGEDETSLTVRGSESLGMFKTAAWSLPDPYDAILDALRPFAGRLTTIHVDEAGIGYHLIPRLRDALESWGVNVVAFNAGWKPNDPSRFINYKAEAYWQFRDLLPEIRGLRDGLMFEQAATLVYKHDGRNRIHIEPKETYKKRAGMSPDRIESAILAYLNPSVSTFQGPPTGPGYDHPLAGFLQNVPTSASLPGWAATGRRRFGR